MAGLIALLHATDQRLELLLDGEVDSVSLPDGTTMLLRRAQGHVRISELARQSAILDALPAHIALLDRQGAIVTVNAAWARSAPTHASHGSGHAPGLDYLALCDSASGDAAEEARAVARGIRQVLARQVELFNMEYACHTPGRLRWFRLTASSLADDAIGGAVIMHSDITEQRLADDAVRRSATLLDAVVSGTADTLFVKDRAGRYLLCNPAFADFAGRDAAEMIGLNNVEIFGAETALSLTGVDQEVIDSGVVISTEDVLHGTLGARTFLTTKAPYRDGSGEVIGVLGISRDISDRKRAERERDSQRQILRTLIDALPDAIYTKDREGRFIVSNRAAQSLFVEQSEDELVGKTVFDVMPADPASVAHAFERDVLAGKGVPEREIAWLDAAGTPTWRSIVQVPLCDASGAVTGLVGIERDVTAVKRDQQALRDLNADLEARVAARTHDLNLARDEAEQANVAKSSFLATMSHEIRTPMNGVIGMLEVLAHTSLEEEQTEMVELVRESAHSLLSIIDDILDFSKIEAGKLVIEHAAVHVGDVVEKVAVTLDDMAANRGVRMTVFIDPAIPPVLRGDAGRLRQVLVNLAGNAIKFSGGRDVAGRVSLRMTMVARRPGVVSVDLSVADNGIGIDDDTIAQLFRPFVQADETTTRRFGGTGLGLAISAMLVGLMGGTIDVRSQVGVGSTFTVHLDFEIADDDDAAAAPAVAAPSAVPPRSIRVVGREAPLVEDLARSLAQQGSEVAVSPTLAAAAAATRGDVRSTWLVLVEEGGSTLDEIRAAARREAPSGIDWVVLGWGRRRKPSREADGTVRIDINSLSRRGLQDALQLARDGSPGAVAPRAVPLPRPRRRTAAEARRADLAILVAEDNETNRKVIVHQLRHLGLRAVVAADGQRAFEAWQAGTFALVLTDLRMPEMDGYHLTQAIRAHESAGKRIPIVALTANAFHEEEVRCREMGMDAYLTKPVQLDELRSTLESLLVDGVRLPAVQEAPVRSAIGAAKPIELDVLRALIGDDEAMVAVVLRAFQESAAAALLAMRRPGAERRTQASHAAHSLKSAARAIGAGVLGELCSTLEADAHASDDATLVRLIDQVDRELGAVLQMIDLHLVQTPHHER